MRPPINRARPFAPAQAAKRAAQQAGADAAPATTETVVLKAKLYLAPGHVPYAIGATVTIAKSLADELIQLGQAELPKQVEKSDENAHA